MENDERNPYVLFTSSILKDWKDNGVNYIKIVALDTDLAVQFFELVPNSEIPDTGETIYNIHSEDVTELLEKSNKVKFVVHEIYLEEDDV
ncbi:hypothetical protein [Pedobacter psychroterrae]|uniref:Uncharacterized protein n=1 Tax=Pedobacter psychroterrae TaxID=2530453 RepID=A0A4R0NHW4_9SPHI|nr:hypothetical protein [Pedobacter psychroterrae]TCD00182.1 hypothetical protein EZ437_15830 [Pedobacter psychroterrae]